MYGLFAINSDHTARASIEGQLERINITIREAEERIAHCEKTIAEERSGIAEMQRLRGEFAAILSLVDRELS